MTSRILRFDLIPSCVTLDKPIVPGTCKLISTEYLVIILSRPLEVNIIILHLERRKEAALANKIKRRDRIPLPALDSLKVETDRQITFTKHGIEKTPGGRSGNHWTAVYNCNHGTDTPTHTSISE